MRATAALSSMRGRGVEDAGGVAPSKVRVREVALGGGDATSGPNFTVLLAATASALVALDMECVRARGWVDGWVGGHGLALDSVRRVRA